MMILPPNPRAVPHVLATTWWLALLWLLSLVPAHAATLTVTSLADGGGACPGANCTLRDAIAAANPGDTITFAVTGTITLGGTQLTINKSLTIQGPGVNLLTISGNNASRVFFIPILPINVTLSGLTIANGRGIAPPSNDGGGIYNDSTGTLSVLNAALTNNSVVSGQGGGIFNSSTGTVNVTNSTLTNNSVSKSGGGSTSGGGINNLVGTVNVTNSTLTNNSVSKSGSGGGSADGGGIYNFNGTVNVTNATLTNNSASASAGGSANGGGIFTAGGTVNVTNATLTNNSASASGSAFPLAQGGGIFTVGGTVNVTNATLANNSASASGGTAINQAFGGGILTLGGTVNVKSTIVALNSVQATGNGALTREPDVLGTFTSQGFNLIGRIDAFASGLTNGVNSDQVGSLAVPIDPLLAPLANNGGPTQTMALLLNSPALDKGMNSGLPTDQRGFARTVDFPARANASDGTDIGAFELNLTDAGVGTVRVSASKTASLLVFPYYTSTIGGGGGGGNPFTNFGPATLEAQGGSDTRMTISNISNAAATVANQAYVHLFLIDGTTCNQADFFLCLTPNASFSFRASDYDPGNTGYVIAVAVNAQGIPIQNNVLIGNAFVTTPTIADNYGAESFWANTAAVAAVSGNTATLQFDNVGYDAVPSQFAVEIQSPLDTAGQQIVTASLSGNLTTSTLTGAAQVGTGQAFNEKELFGSFNGWLLGTCQARATISIASPRVPNGLGNLIRTGQAGYLKFNVGGAVGLLLTPRGGAWAGIRTLHKTQTMATTLTIPIFVPVC